MADTKPTLNPTPKQRFIQSTAIVSAHRNLMQSDQLRMSLDFALLEYQRRVSETSNPDMNGAVAGHFRMLGAQEFINTLIMLAETPVIPTVKPQGNLDHSK